MGTAAFGSFIIAVIQMIRFIIMQIQKKIEQMPDEPAYVKATARALMCACQCYMWCVEKCMKFINKNAYIQTAIYSVGFCEGAKNAFFLILRNLGRITAIAMVST